jgi:hypothetical protein
MAKEKTETSTEKKTRERGIDVESVTKLSQDIKAKAPENSRILLERLGRYVDASDEKVQARESLKAAIKFIKG